MRCRICNDMLDDSAIDFLCYDCYISSSYEDVDRFIDDDDIETDLFDDNFLYE